MRMLDRRSTVAVVLSWFILLVSAATTLGAESQIIHGNARFTIITPHLIRLEYAPTRSFVDEPSWFAVNRETRFDGSDIRTDGPTLTIDTGIIRLTHRDDGQPFSPQNLSAVIRRGEQTVTWEPGMPNTGNLGGTIRTLDMIAGAVPLGEGVVSRDGWYLLDDSGSHLFVGDWIRARPNKENLDWYLYGYGDDLRAALRSLTAVGGQIPLPRKYVLGIWFSRHWPFSADDYRSIVAEYESHGFPLDMLVLDMDWHLNRVPEGVRSARPIDTWTGFTWDKALIPDPAGLLRWLHEQGLHVTLNDHPASGVQPHEEMYADFMRAMGQDPASGETIPFDAGSKTYMDTFWEHTHTPRDREGVDFWWLDWQQYPFTRSLPELENLKVLNWYYYQRSTRDDQRGLSFSRWAGWGDHRYPIHFSGDAFSNWEMLAAQVPFTTTAGNVGAFFWSHDIGGHQGGRNEESYTRWCQFGALTTALRSHSMRDPNTDRRPWNYPKWAEESMRISFRLRARLMPYIYTAIQQAHAESVPFTRPLYLDYPTIETAYHQSQEFLFGDNLLVAPIATPGIGPNRFATQAVWFPPGSDWFDFFTGERFAGGEHAVAGAPIDRFPLYVRGGVPLPMQPYTSRPTTAKLETLILRCYPGRDGVVGTSSLYEDDGVTTAYQRGESARTPLSYVRNGDVVTITVGPTEGRYEGQPQQRALVIELPCTLPGATSDDAACTYDQATATTRLELPAGPIDTERKVTVRVKEMPADQVIAAAVESRLNALLGMPYDDWRQANPQPDAAMQAAIAAAHGVAVLPVHQHPYALGDDVALVFLSNHRSEPIELTLKPAGDEPRQISVRSGDAIARSPSGETAGLPYRRPATIEGLPGPVPSLMLTLPDALPADRNLARRATVEASTGTAPAAIDGSIEGYPRDQRKEWVTDAEKAGAWIRLTWDEPMRVSQVLLYDRPNLNDHVLAGVLEFSDGSRIDVPALPNDGQEPVTLTFAPKTCTWMRFVVIEAADRTENIGLSEIGVAGEAGE